MCKKTYKSWIAAIAAITACVLFAVNFRVTFVDGQSMEPTLKSHQLVLVKRTAASIQRDDIIVFRVDETVYIKRVVAVAGDTVQLKDSRVYINHVYLSPYTCDADIAAAYNLEADHYFVLGDNDGASIDSRDFGIISKEHIIGKVILFCCNHRRSEDRDNALASKVFWSQKTPGGDSDESPPFA